MTTLALLRHGQSQWNLENRFTGWEDVDLTDTGEAEARRAGRLLKDTGVDFAEVHTSVLKRAIRTSWLALEEMDRTYLPELKDWRLNERHYGALTGLDKAETAAAHGEDQVRIWRRSYDIPPPPLADDDARHPRFDPRYAEIDDAELPATESLKTTLDRVLPYWSTMIEPSLEGGRSVIVVAHGNSLRATMKHIFGVSDADILNFEVPTGNPLLVRFDGPTLNLIDAAYLDTARSNKLPPSPAVSA